MPILAAVGLLLGGFQVKSPGKLSPRRTVPNKTTPARITPAKKSSDLLAPPTGLDVTIHDISLAAGQDGGKTLEQRVSILFHNTTRDAYDAVELEFTTKSVGLTKRTRIRLESDFESLIIMRKGSLLPGELTQPRTVKMALPVELYNTDRKTDVRVLGVRPAPRTLDLARPDSVWVFMLTATPLQIADALKSHPELVRYQAPGSVTPALMACARQDVEPLEAVLSAGGTLKEGTLEGLSPLHMAAMSGGTLMIDRLIRAGVALDGPSLFRLTPLHVAIVYQNPVAVSALIAKGANLNTPDSRGWTPLMDATQMDDRGFARTLVEAGADLRIADRNGFSYMNLAAAGGDLTFLKLGLDRGFGIDEVDPETGRAPLQFAARYYRIGAVKWLLDHGADPELRAKDGLRPFDRFLKYDDHPVDRRFMEEAFATHGKGRR